MAGKKSVAAQTAKINEEVKTKRADEEAAAQAKEDATPYYVSFLSRPVVKIDCRPDEKGERKFDGLWMALFRINLFYTEKQERITSTSKMLDNHLRRVLTAAQNCVNQRDIETFYIEAAFVLQKLQKLAADRCRDHGGDMISFEVEVVHNQDDPLIQYETKKTKERAVVLAQA